MRISRTLLLSLVVTAVISGFSVAPAAAQQPICFPGTPGISDCIDPAFAAFWQTNGGLPIFGYPIAPAGPYTPEGAAAPLQAQWFERNRLELHPESQAPYTVQIGRVGAERLAQLGRDHWAGGGEPGPQPGCLWFPETRQNVCDQAEGLGFKSYWEGSGLRISGMSRYQQSLALFGLPLTTANPEPTASGELVLTQWFERARFEWHPENPERSRVLLGLLGSEVWAAAAPPAGTPTPASSDPILGVEITRGAVGASVGALSSLGPTMVRFNLVDWNTIEPRQGQRDWSLIAGQEAELATISAAGGSPMVVIGGLSPEWARRQPDKACGPLKASALPAFADYVGELVRRYSAPPYNVRYWEVGNEPDAPYQILPGDAPFGCWGDQRDPGFGGGAYAEMLKTIYPAIKAADPNAKVVTGGLLLDCDPTADPSCGMGRFLEGMLKNGGGDAFDILAYHSYVYWVPTRLDWDFDHPIWKHRGGNFVGKLDFVREIMARYGVDKPVLMNEGGLLCRRSNPSCAPQGFHQDQANALMRMFARSYDLGLYGIVWYTLNGPGWQESGLLDAAQQPRPAYTTMRFLKRTLVGATHEGVTREGALEIHRFRKGDTRYEVAWTNDSSTRDLPLPAGARALYSVVGEQLTLGQQFTVGFEPTVIESAAP